MKDVAFSEKIDRADGLAIVTPEYNRSFPGSLKHALDTCYPEYRYKAAGVCGVSSGKVGGARAITALLPVLKTFGLYMIRPEVYFASVSEAFSESGEVQDQELLDGYEKQISSFLDELIRVTREMRTLRANLK